ncbi:MAG TPA: MFS transporter [Polyangia bacterium]|nr:MFS transporter [Polyangia bacterium]
MRGLPRSYWFLWAASLVNRLGGFVYTFLALYLHRARHFTIAEAGFVVMLYGLGSFASGPVGGYFADHVGRRRTMLASFGLGAAAMLQLGFARAPWHIAVSALALGFCNDLFRPAQAATVADVVAPADRTRAFGYLYWAVNLGFAGAAMLAGFLARSSFTWLFIGDAATTLACGLIVYRFVPESHPERHSTAKRPRPDPRAPLRDRVFMIYVLAQFLTMLVGSQGNSTLPIDVTSHGVPESQYGLLMAINGLMIVLFQPWAVRIVQRYRRARVLALGALLQGIGFGLTGAGHGWTWYAGTVFIWSVAELIYSPVTPTVTADLSPAHLRGSYQGMSHMAWGASACLAPALGSLVLGRFGSGVLWSGCFALCLISTAMHIVIGPARRRRLQTMSDDGVAREDGHRAA